MQENWVKKILQEYCKLFLSKLLFVKCVEQWTVSWISIVKRLSPRDVRFVHFFLQEWNFYHVYMILSDVLTDGGRKTCVTKKLTGFSCLLIREAGHNHQDSQDWQTSQPWDILCPGVEVLEILLLHKLTHHLQLADSQHGFRRQRCTTSALLSLVHKSVVCFNLQKLSNCTVMLVIAVSKAFDTANHTKLLQAVTNTTLP